MRARSGVFGGNKQKEEPRNDKPIECFISHGGMEEPTSYSTPHFVLKRTWRQTEVATRIRTDNLTRTPSLTPYKALAYAQLVQFLGKQSA